MKFLCGSCRTKYQISEEKVRGKVLTIRCQKCGSKVKVREPQQALAPGEPFIAEVTVEARAVAANAGVRVPVSDLAIPTFNESDEAPTRVQGGGHSGGLPTDVDWFTATDGKQQGPFTFTDLMRRIAARETVALHYVWNHKMEAWKRIRDIPELFARLPNGTPPPPQSAQGRFGEVEERVFGEIVDLAEKRAQLERTKRGGSNDSLDFDIDDPDSDQERTVHEDQHPVLKTKAPPPPAFAPRPPAGAAAPAPAFAPRPPAVPPKAWAAATPAPPKPGITVTPVSREATKSERTPVAPEPLDAVALHTTTPVARGTGHSANVANLAHLDLAADLFAGLPRLQADAPSPQRESTRFFIAAAGVNTRKQRNVVGIVLGIAGFLAFASFIAAWASGFVNLPIPSSVNPFIAARERAEKEALEDEAGDDDSDDPSVRALDGRRPKKRKRTKAAVVQAPPSGSVSGPSSGQAAAPADQAASGPHGDEAAPDVIKFDPQTGKSTFTGQIKDVELPEAKPGDLMPPADAKELSPAIVNQVIAQRKSSVRICYQESLRSNENLRGKVMVEITVRPSGDVAKVSVVSREHKNGIGACIAERMREWKFPSFEGHENATVRAGFVLEKD